MIGNTIKFNPHTQTQSKSTVTHEQFSNFSNNLSIDIDWQNRRHKQMRRRFMRRTKKWKEKNRKKRTNETQLSDFRITFSIIYFQKFCIHRRILFISIWPQTESISYLCFAHFYVYTYIHYVISIEHWSGVLLSLRRFQCTLAVRSNILGK